MHIIVPGLVSPFPFILSITAEQELTTCYFTFLEVVYTFCAGSMNGCLFWQNYKWCVDYVRSGSYISQERKGTGLLEAYKDRSGLLGVLSFLETIKD